MATSSLVEVVGGHLVAVISKMVVVGGGDGCASSLSLVWWPCRCHCRDGGGWWWWWLMATLLLLLMVVEVVIVVVRVVEIRNFNLHVTSSVT